MAKRRWHPETRRLNCPNCQKDVSALPIAYGYPSPELEEQAKKEEVILGGCMPMPWQWFCPDCRKPIPSDDDDWECYALPGETPDEARRRWEKEGRQAKLWDETDDC
jgi:endogenous inhibitor of DNA gyrase (YacG/DUF329 family)